MLSFVQFCAKNCYCQSIVVLKLILNCEVLSAKLHASLDSVASICTIFLPLVLHDKKDINLPVMLLQRPSCPFTFSHTKPNFYVNFFQQCLQFDIISFCRYPKQNYELQIADSVRFTRQNSNWCNMLTMPHLSVVKALINIQVFLLNFDQIWKPFSKKLFLTVKIFKFIISAYVVHIWQKKWSKKVSHSLFRFSQTNNTLQQVGQ